VLLNLLHLEHAYIGFSQYDGEVLEIVGDTQHITDIMILAFDLLSLLCVVEVNETLESSITVEVNEFLVAVNKYVLGLDLRLWLLVTTLALVVGAFFRFSRLLLLWLNIWGSCTPESNLSWGRLYLFDFLFFGTSYLKVFQVDECRHLNFRVAVLGVCSKLNSLFVFGILLLVLFIVTFLIFLFLFGKLHVHGVVSQRNLLRVGAVIQDNLRVGLAVALS
jgi:hypothetical protein